jgi:phosphatidylglycerophosphatase A
MEITDARVASTHAWVVQQSPDLTSNINEVRADLGRSFEVAVEEVDVEMITAAIESIFSDRALAVNVTAYIAILRAIDVPDDYPGFVVDEVLGRRLAATIAGGDPLGLLAEATFHIIDRETHTPGTAGLDDLRAGLVAGLQTRLPGWPWREL